MPVIRKVDPSDVEVLTNAQSFVCPDCVKEGNAEPQPLANFYTFHAEGYVNEQRRSIPCRRHFNARRAARMRERLDPTSEKYNPQLHERQKQAKREYWRKRAGSNATDARRSAHDEVIAMISKLLAEQEMSASEVYAALPKRLRKLRSYSSVRQYLYAMVEAGELTRTGSGVETRYKSA